MIHDHTIHKTPDPSSHSEPGTNSEPDTSSEHDWRTIHERLVQLSREAAHIDWEIGQQLLRAQRAGCHLRLGFGSLLEYADRLLGYAAHTTTERLRVASCLEDLPQTAQALRSGEISFSAARELTRVATPETESKWLAGARQKTVREVERLVKGHRLGDSPEDRADPSAEQHVLRFSVSAETYATFREAVGQLRKESEIRFEDDDLLLLIARKLLGGPSDDGRSSYQLAIFTCEKCQRNWQQAQGDLVEIDDAVREKAACDAQCIGSVDSIVVSDPSAASDPSDPSAASAPSAARDPNKRRRATQSIPPGTRRLVMSRHHRRCGVPGCTHADYVDVHHVQLRSEGGDHNPEYLAVLCGAHHAAIHAGRLLIDGSASVGFRFKHADGSPYGRVADPVAADHHAKAFFALTNLGYKQGEARRALDAVRSQHSMSHVGPDEPELTAESLILRALQQLLPKSMRAA